METLKQNKLIGFIDWLNERATEKEELNQSQRDFLDLVNEKSSESDKLNKFLKKNQIYENAPENLKNIEELNKGGWTELYKKLSNNQKIASNFSNAIYYDTELLEDENEINFMLRYNEDPMPVEIGLFIRTVHEVQEAIKELYKNDPRLVSNLRSLEGIASIGGGSSFVDLAKQQLEQFKFEIILQKGNDIKRKYLRNLGYAGLGIALLCTILLILPKAFDFKYQYEHIFQNGVVMIIGSCIGTWLSFSIRKKEIKFEELRLLNDGYESPVMRMLILVLIALSFYFMFITNFLNISIGESFTTGAIGEKGSESLAFLIGIFIGLTENSIGLTLTKRIETFTSKL